MKRSIILILLLALLVPLAAQEAESTENAAPANPFAFTAGISLGTDILPGLNGTTEIGRAHV